MYSALFIAFFASLLSSLVLILSYALSARSQQDRNKLSPFECGFDPKNSARLPFSLRFFLLAVIFLVFDIEIVLLLPVPLLNQTPIFSPALFGAFFFLGVLLLGLLHEWNEGSLDWVN